MRRAVTALVAAAQWDALAIDYRDAVILQPLPIRPAALRLAKLTAVATLGAGVAVAVNIFPTIVFPWMLAFAVPQMGAAQLFQMIATQAVITVAAAIFGFLAVVAVREWASALLGDSLFARVSPWLQTIAIAGAAMYAFARGGLRVGPAAALAGAAVFAFNGHMVGNLAQLHNHATLAWAPLVLLAIQRVIELAPRREAWRWGGGESRNRATETETQPGPERETGTWASWCEISRSGSGGSRPSTGSRSRCPPVSSWRYWGPPDRARARSCGSSPGSSRPTPGTSS